MTETLNLRDFPPVEENIDPPESLRQSLLAKHNLCPRSAYLSQTVETASHQMDRGTAFHRFAEQAITDLLDAEEQTMPGDVARALADEIMAESHDLVLTTEEQDAVRLMAWNWAESFVFDPEAHVATEIPLEMELLGWTLTGTLDRVEASGNSLYVHDYKTSLNVRKNEEVQRGFQGMMYALLLLEGTIAGSDGTRIGAGINDVWFYETYPRYRSDEGLLTVKEASWDRGEIHEFKTSLERNLAAFERSLETGDWPARSGSWCGSCPAQTLCPIPEHHRQIPKIEDQATAEAFFELKLANEREGRRIQNGLREYRKDTDAPLIVGDLAFDAKHSESFHVKDWDEMLLALKRTAEIGVPFRMEDHVEQRSSTKFAKRKLTPEELEERDGSAS